MKRVRYGPPETISSRWLGRAAAPRAKSATRATVPISAHRLSQLPWGTISIRARKAPTKRKAAPPKADTARKARLPSQMFFPIL